MGKLKKYQPAEANLQITESLFQEFPDSDLIDVLREMLGATRVFVQKDGNVIETPDWPARDRAMRLIFEYRLGKPVQRQEIVTHNTNSTADVVEMARQNPGFRAALRQILEEPDNQDG